MHGKNSHRCEAIHMRGRSGQSFTSSSTPTNNSLKKDPEKDPLPSVIPQSPSLDSPSSDFTQHEAQSFRLSHSNVLSHNPHLNSDGEALYRFLLSEAASLPTLRVTCTGTHPETRTRWVTLQNSESRIEVYTEIVTDFNFCIDIVPNTPPIQWSVADDEPAYRGLVAHEFETGTGRRVAKGQKLKRQKEWEAKQKARGLPPWVREEDTHITDGSTAPLDGLKSSKTIRQWTDEYCASQKYLKEFLYKKILYGWNMEQIESAIRSKIECLQYDGTIEIDFSQYRSEVYIRADNAVSRMLKKKWLKFLSTILLVSPFIWLFKRFHSHGEGHWEVCGGAYALKQWIPLDPGEEIETDQLPPYNPSSASKETKKGYHSSRYMQTPTGPKKLLGMTEGEWFKSWEGAITRAVIDRYQSSTPLSRE